MAAREIPGLATVLGRIDGAMAPAAAWCERHGVSHMYIIVADQRAVQLSGGGKPYLMRMMGTLYPVAISPDAPPAALEVAARDRLRALLRAGSGKSGGTDVLSGYGSARVDGM